MNRFCAVLVVVLASAVVAEPPSPSISYGLPSGWSKPSTSYGAPSGWSSSYAPSHVDYVEHSVGHQTNEGLILDQNLLHKIEHILIQHENSGKKISVPSIAYGVPQDHYGPPAHWKPSSKVVGINFGHLRQSIPVAYYIGKERYASGWDTGSSGWDTGSTGWSTGSKGSGWETISIAPTAEEWSTKPVLETSWKPSVTSGWSSKPSTTYGIPSGWSISVPKPPSQTYGAPRW